ncbi:MAG TPA: hypothetical protein VN797_08665 [Gemmatimonadaceae bacterium]|jgi:hypothetical protein|nr:hypothetical protein [Gemmatimonadaceae bacterium]
MRHALRLTIALMLFSSAGFAQSAAQSAAAAAPQLSAEQKQKAAKIINSAKEHGKVLAERLAAAGKQFDEVLLGEKADVAADGRAADSIKAVLAESAETRLEAARKVVHLLSPEQRSYLKAEMAKPDSERGILEAFAKVFQIEQAK